MKKFLSLLLTVVLVLTTVFTGAVAVSAETTTAAEGEIDTSLRLVASPYPLSDYKMDDTWTSKVTNESDISITDCGVDGSYGLKLVGDGDNSVVALKLGGVGILPSSTSVIVKFDAKVSSERALKGFAVATMDRWFSHTVKAIEYVDEENGVEEVTTEWKTFVGTCVTHEKSGENYNFIRIDFNLSEGEVLYLDNISIHPESDTATNYFKKGTFDADVHYEAYVKEPTLSATYTPYEMIKYKTSWATERYDVIASNATLAEGKGISGSYALAFDAGSYSDVCAHIANPADAYFQAGETYRIGFKAKKVGTVSNFKFKFETTDGWKIPTLLSVELTDEWIYYAVDFNFDANGFSAAGHKHWGISATVGEDSYLYIDDVEIYNINDSSKTNYYTLGSFDICEITKDVTYEPYTWEDYDFAGSANDPHTMLRGDDTVIPENVTIVEGGVDDSYALKIVGDGAAHELSLYIGAPSALPSSTKMNVSFAAKVSSENALSAFAIGTMNRWWTGVAKSTEFNATTAAQVTTDWKSFAGTLTTDKGASGNHVFVYIKYNLPEGEALYLDNISVKAVNDSEYFWQGSFDKATEGYTKLDKEPENAILGAKYNEVGAEIIAVEPAISGENVLAVGLKDTAVENRIWFETGYVRPCETYKLEMWIKVVGDVSTLSITMSDCDPWDSDTTVDPPENVSILNFSGTNTTKTYLPRTWVKIEKTWTDLTTATSGHQWAGLQIWLKAPAGAGVLIDSVSIKPVGEEFGVSAPNLFTSAGFEADYSVTPVEWSNTYTTNGDILDLSFMNSLPKSFGLMGNNLQTEYDQYFDISNKDGDFGFANMAIIDDTTNVEIVTFETREALKNGKEIWLDATAIVGSSALYANWKTRLDKVAYTIQSLAGDQFQGIYFDEPCFHFANNEEFIEVTKYIRETYKKRVFSMAQPGMLGLTDYVLPKEDDNPDNDDETSFKVYVSAESHKYVTDFGVWRYTASGAEAAAKNLVKDAAKLDPNVRLWICGLMGRNSDTKVESDNIKIMNNMLNVVKAEPNFGGVLVWDVYASKGYDLLKPDESGVVIYNDYRNLLMAIAKDLQAKDSWAFEAFGTPANADNVVVLNSDIWSDELISALDPSYHSLITVLNAGEPDSTASKLANNPDITLMITSLTTSVNNEYYFALANDVNCDNAVTAADIVRAKRIVAQDYEGNIISYAAAGADSQTGMSVLNIATVRANLLK